MILRNNTVSGVWHSGFRVYSHTCGDEDLAITDNVAHSVSGFGVIVLNGGGSCSEFSRFYGYKNHLATVHFGSAGHARVKDVVSIDSKYGITVIPGSFADVQYNTIYGSKDMENSDCPLSETGKCGCMSRYGVMAPTFGGSPIEMKNKLKIKKMFAAGGGWGGKSLFKYNKFIGFDSK